MKTLTISTTTTATKIVKYSTKASNAVLAEQRPLISDCFLSQALRHWAYLKEKGLCIQRAKLGAVNAPSKQDLVHRPGGGMAGPAPAQAYCDRKESEIRRAGRSQEE